MSDESVEGHGPGKGLALSYRLVSQSEGLPRTIDIKRYNLTEPEDWAHISVLIDLKYESYVRDKHPAQYRKWAESKQAPSPELFDEFLIEQARTIGPLVLFNAKVLATLYNWSLHPKAGSKLWHRLAANVQGSLDGKRASLNDERSHRTRSDLINDLKIMKRGLRRKHAVAVGWNFTINLETLSKELVNFRGSEVLEKHGSRFLDFVRNKERLFKDWLLQPRSSDANLADAFIAWLNGYKSPESARQAIMTARIRFRTKTKSVPDGLSTL